MFDKHASAVFFAMMVKLFGAITFTSAKMALDRHTISSRTPLSHTHHQHAKSP